MHALTSTGATVETTIDNLIIGQTYSLYIAGHAWPGGGAQVPNSGTLAIYHLATSQDDAEFPVLDVNGAAVTADLATVQGIAVNFVAHHRGIVIRGTDLEADDSFAYSLIPIRP